MPTVNRSVGEVSVYFRLRRSADETDWKFTVLTLFELAVRFILYSCRLTRMDFETSEDIRLSKLSTNMCSLGSGI